MPNTLFVQATFSIKQEALKQALNDRSKPVHPGSRWSDKPSVGNSTLPVGSSIFAYKMAANAC